MSKWKKQNYEYIRRKYITHYYLTLEQESHTHTHTPTIQHKSPKELINKFNSMIFKSFCSKSY